nr:E-beta-farnesene synthase [Tanacetum cinerariifolium]
FTASSTIPSIYIQQFWDTVRYDKSAGCYKCQLDEQWFDLTKDTLRDVLQITPVNDNQAFTSPPSSDALISFVNELGYPKIWEEFTQSIHTFIEDKRNLAQHIYEKKKATLIVIPSIRFTKLIIYHLQRQHKFHPRPDSSLHFPNEEPVLGYLKFSAKGTKREVFGMPIPGSLITADIQKASYYQEYLAKVAKHQRYLASETGSDPDSPAPKPTKTARRPKPTTPKAHPRPLVSKPVSSTQPEPKSAPAKTQGRKRKLTTKISDKPSKAMKSICGLVSKKRKPLSSLRSVDETVAEDVPEKEPQVDDEEADVQRALEESMKSMYDVPRGPLPPVVIKEPESEKYQSLPEVPRKGKKRRTSTPTGSSKHNESSSLYAEVGLIDSDEESEKDMPGADTGGQGEGQAGPYTGAQAEGQAGPDPGAQDEGQAGSNPDIQPEGQARPDPGNAETSQPMPSPVVHAGSDRKHMDLDVADVSTQPPPEKMDEGFTTTAYPKVSKAINEVVTDAVDWAMQAPLRNRFRDLLEADMKEILHQRMWEPDSFKSHEDHMQLYEALEKSMNRDHSEELAKDLAEACKKKKKSRESSKTPPGSPPHQPPPPPPPAGPSGVSRSSRASGSSQVPPPPPPPPSANQEDLQMDEDMAPDEQAQSSDDEDIERAHIPKTCTVHLEDEGGLLSDVVLEQMVPDQIWIEEECKYDIAAMYGISHWWFQRQRFYIDRHTSEGYRRAVRTHMRILSVVRIKVFSMYVYDYMKKIVLRRADLNEHVIAERDFKYLYPSDFEDLYLLNLQEDFQLGIESYQTQLNLTKPRWDATGFEYKHDYTVIDSPRDVTFQDRYGVQMIMRFNEIHKFSDGTLQQIDEVLDYRVKEFKINMMNPGLNTRFWTRKDVDRSKEFMFAIQKRLKTRRIFRNLESFIGGRIRDGGYRLLKRTE